MDIIDIVLSKKYTDESLKGITGTLAGKNCTIKSATKADGVTTVVFAWTADDGTEKTTTIQVNDGAKGDIGIGIDNVTINANSHLIVTLSDGSTIDAGLIQGDSGTDDYEDLINRPKIEGVDLIGNKTLEDLGVASATDLAQTDGHLQDLADLVGDKANLPMPNDTVVNNIEYVDTKVDGLIDDNATGLTKTFSSDKIAKTFATLEEVNERIPQYEIMPTATESCGGQVVQFIGTSTSDYTHGYFYQCVPEGSGYIWKNVGVQAIPVNLSELTNDSGYITVNVDNLVNYYLKTETYSQAEVDEIIGKLNRLTTEIVTALPTENISTTTIYLIKVGETNNYTQHMYIGDAWADLGSTTIDLSGYVSKQQLTTTLADYVKSTDLQAHVDNNTVHLTIEDRDNLTNLLLDEHNHGNKKILDGILQAQVDNWNEAFTDKHTHDNKTVLDGITSTKVSDWDSAKTHADSAHAPSNAQENVIETVKVNGTALTPSNKAVNIDLSDYAKTADIPTALPANGGNADTVNGHTVGIDVPSDAKFTDTTYSDATQIEHGLMSVDDKKKLDGLKKYTPDGTTITMDEDGTLHGQSVDDALSDTSTNPVQNKVVKAYVDKKASENVDFSTSTSKLLNDTVEAPLMLSNATRNLLNPTLQTTTSNGVTCTNNGDGTYTLNGTATKDVFFDINKNIPINKGTKYKVVCFKDEDYVPNKILSCIRRVDISKEYLFNNGSFVSDTENCWLWIKIAKNVTVSNLIAKPMITTDLDATYDDFIPYSGYDIKTCGKNLLNLTKITTNNTGVTASLSNGIITLDGTVDTSGGWKDIYFGTPEQWVSLKRGVKYTISTKDKVQKVFILLRKATGLKALYTHDCYTNGTTFVASEDMVCQVTITFKESSTFNNKQIAPQIEVGEKATEYEQYQDGGTVHIDSTTKFPLLGLKSFDGITNIISLVNVKCVYPTNESGKGVLDSLYNKDKMLTEQNESLAVIGKCKNLLNSTSNTDTHNGITFTRNDDGTYSLSGSRTDTSISAYTTFVNNFPLEKGKYKLTGAVDENNYIRCIVNKPSGTNIYDYGDGCILDVNETGIAITLLIVTTDDTSQTRIIKPMLTTDLSATYNDFVPYTGDGETLASDVAEIKNDLGGLSFSASGTTLSITDGTNTWTLKANS